MELFLLDCPTYNSYLERFLTKADRYYLYNYKDQLKLVTINYRGNAKIYTAEEFKERKKQIMKQFYTQPRKSEFNFRQLVLMDPVVAELVVRDKLNQQKLISTIIFMRTHNKRGMEISGFIDYEHSLRRSNEKAKNSINWEAVFNEQIIFRPRTTDLSYLDWHTGRVFYNNTANYIVMHNIEGLSFMYRGDHKMICVGKDKSKGNKNFSQSTFFSEKYGYVTLYDHIIRKKF